MARELWIYRSSSDYACRCYGEKAFFYRKVGRRPLELPARGRYADRLDKDIDGGNFGQQSTSNRGIDILNAIKEDLEISREEIDRVREVAGLVGVDYNTILNNDLRFYQSLIRGYMRRREYAINDSLQVGHVIAEKIAMAVWGDKNFLKPIKHIEIVEPTPREKRTRRIAHLKSLLEGE